MAIQLSENAAQLTPSVTVYTKGSADLGQQITTAWAGATNTPSTLVPSSVSPKVLRALK